MSNLEIIDTIVFNPEVVTSKSFLIKHTPNGCYFKVEYGPFSNCQVFGIAPFINVLHYLCKNDPTKVTETIKEIADLCNIKKHLCQVDIKQTYYDAIKEHVDIHVSVPYTNLTFSKMVIALIKI